MKEYNSPKRRSRRKPETKAGFFVSKSAMQKGLCLNREALLYIILSISAGFFGWPAM
jgi:hypothetical protein